LKDLFNNTLVRFAENTFALRSRLINQLGRLYPHPATRETRSPDVFLGVQHRGRSFREGFGLEHDVR
jgi:hypothetical protein